MDIRYHDVEFSFQGDHAEEDPTALGTVIVRADGAMVLQLAESDDDPPFCEIVAQPKDGAFAGENQRGALEISAAWRMQGRQGTGTWIEAGITYALSFTLPAQ